jgi:phage FluMu gp28-like protein
MRRKRNNMFSPDQTLRWADAFLKYNDVPVELDPWQEIFLKDKNPFIILLKGRQEGFSFAVAAKKFIELQDLDVKNMTVQFVSYNLQDAVDKIRYISIMAHSMPEKNRKKIASETKTSIEFLDKGGKTTSRLISIACRPPRGKPGDIVLDECAIYGSRKAKMIYTAALPSITRGGTITIGSTPLGKIGIFYEIYTDRKNFKNYHRYTVPWWQSRALCKDLEKARKAGVKDMDTMERVMLFGKKILKEEMAALDFQSFQQEYECVFIDSAESYIPLDLIYANTPGRMEGERDAPLQGDAGEDPDDDIEVHVFKTADELLASYSALGNEAISRYGHLYMGYDVARRRDAAVIFVIGHLPNGKKISVAEIEMRNAKFEFQLDQFKKIMKSLPVQRACIDQTGQGEPLCERLQEEFGYSKVEGIIFNLESKGILALNVKTGLEKQEFLLQNDSKFHRQIHSIKRIPTAGGNFRYDSERDEDGHADSFWAWALANHAVFQSLNHSPNYWEQRARLKGKSALQSDHKIPSSQTEPDNLTPVRGKSLNSVLRGVRKNAYNK